jgi:iron complex transport system permease protein
MLRSLSILIAKCRGPRPEEASQQARRDLAAEVALLVGVVQNSICGALILLVLSLRTPTGAQGALVWLVGSISEPSLLGLGVLGGYVTAGVLGLWLLAPTMNALAFGEDTAHSIGIHTERARRALFFGASLLTGVAVAFSGPIGFIGLLVPHLLRPLVGADHRILIPLSALVGGALLVLADLASRLAFLVLDVEVPVGVTTALLGAPFFLFVLRRRPR